MGVAVYQKGLVPLISFILSPLVETTQSNEE